MNQYVLEGQKRLKEDKRALASKVARHFTIKKNNLNDAHFVAIMASHMAGQWEFEAVAKALHAAEIETRFHDIEREFMDAGILIHAGKESRQFSLEFQKVAADLVSEMVRLAPPKLKPMTEPAEDWITPFRYDFNLPLISNMAPEDLEEYTPENYPDFYEAVNRMQRVAFRIPCYLPPFLDREIKVHDDLANQKEKEYHAHRHPQARKRLYHQARAAKQKANQIRTQVELIKELQQHDKLYFLVTADFRGRLYYRGGIVTPQGNDFCKAAFQFAQ